jgi:hypothetical protein
MRSSQPPIVAAWVLTHFGNRNEVLAGDLIEEYRRGRSAAWYCRQVVVALLIGYGKEIRTHKLLAVRALVIGWAALILSSYLIRTVFESVGGFGTWPTAVLVVALLHLPSSVGAVYRWFSQRLACSSLPSNISGRNGEHVRGICAAHSLSRVF